MRRPLLNLRNSLWCCGVCLSRSESASRPPAHVLLSPGYARLPGCAASRSSIIFLCTAFFRLSGLAHGRFIALKAGVLIQDGVAGIAERLVIGNLLVMGLARIGLTQIPHPFGLGVHHHHIVVTISVVLAAVVQDFCWWFLR